MILFIIISIISLVGSRYLADGIAGHNARCLVALPCPVIIPTQRPYKPK